LCIPQGVVTGEYGAMRNDEWQGKTDENQRQTSFIATSREENKFLNGFQTLRTFITEEKLVKM
jgi:hypothetical protein